MDYILKLLVLVIVTLVGGLLFALSVNLLIMGDMIPAEQLNASFGREITNKAVYVWFGAIILGLISIFIKEKWRYFLLFSPMVMPSAFAFIYALSL